MRRVWVCRVPFRILLPLLALAVWVGIVAVPAMSIYNELRAVTGNVKNATVTEGTRRTTIPPESFAAYAVNEAVVTHSHVITALNLPGALMEMPVSLATTLPEVWYPRRLELWTWRALATVVSCLPAWWLAGLGLEALLGRRRLRWPWVALGGAACGLLLVMLGGFLFGVSAGPGGGWVYAGLVLWIVLFAVLPGAAVRQGMESRG